MARSLIPNGVHLVYSTYSSPRLAVAFFAVGARMRILAICSLVVVFCATLASAANNDLDTLARILEHSASSLGQGFGGSACEAAAALYKEGGKDNNAISMYKHAAERHEEAANDHHLRLDYESAADEYTSAAEAYKRQGNHVKAEQKFKEAAEMCLNVISYGSVDPTRKVSSAEMYERAARLHESGGGYVNAGLGYCNAASEYEKQGNDKKAAELYEKAANMHGTVHGRFTSSWKHENAAEWYCNAARIYKKLGNVGKVAEMREREAQEKENTALGYRREKEYKNAVDRYSEAAEIYKELWNTRKVAEMYEKMSEVYNTPWRCCGAWNNPYGQEDSENREIAAEMYVEAIRGYAAADCYCKWIQMQLALFFSNLHPSTFTLLLAGLCAMWYACH